MNNTRWIFFVLLVVAGFYIAMAGIYIALGQHRPPVLVVVNNSGQQLQVVSEGAPVIIPPNTASEVKYPGNTQRLSIRASDGRSWKYKWAPIPTNYWPRPRIFLQVEQDARIYILPVIT